MLNDLKWRNYQTRIVVFSLIGATCLSLIATVVDAVPMMTHYQGTLQDARGAPLNTIISMTFSLYDTPEGGTPLWTETHLKVTVTQGIFSVVLGSVVNFTATDIEGERYLGVTVGNDEEMLPRHALTSAAFAMRAGVAESVTDFTGHSATELDDLISVGSGAIITTKEREKLGNLTDDVPLGHLQIKGSIWLEQQGEPPALVDERLYNQGGELYWNGAPLIAVTETDPTVAVEVKDGVSWGEVSDKPMIITTETDPTLPSNLKDGVSWSEVADKPSGFDDDIDNVGITSLSGHSATELDDLTSVGSGAIITAEEREKLGSLTEGSILLEPSEPPSPVDNLLYNQAGELHWNGSPLTVITEEDPTVAAEVKDGVSWDEVSNKPNIITAETDPTLPSNLKDGVNWSEIANKPNIITTETDPTLPSNLKDGVSWSEVANKPNIITTETDPTLPSNLKDGVSWSEVLGKPSSFNDNVDNVGITQEADPTVPNNLKDGVDWSEIRNKPTGMGMHFINPRTITNQGGPIGWTYYGASSFIPSKARTVILDYQCAMNSPDNGDVDAHILVRAHYGSGEYILARLRSAGKGDEVAWGGMGFCPVDSSRNFQYSITPPGANKGCTIRLIGYVY